ncbi:TM0106 family RecB-like putative nuclease [Corynebacterium choanae]|uniref:TM0106 family RecB-like putative nuclease n=1 Tax=Corynebacterium choanae TaxID=1862358 RepID=UPI0036715280
MLPRDLVGCRYAVHQRTRWPHAAPTEATLRRAGRAAAVRDDVFALLPDKPAPGEPGAFRRIDIDAWLIADGLGEPEVLPVHLPGAQGHTATPTPIRESETATPSTTETAETLEEAATRWWFGQAYTLEAMAAGATIITGARLSVTVDGQEFQLAIDVLVKNGDTYLPVLLSQHRVARPHAGASQLLIGTKRLGLAAPVRGPWKMKHHAHDGYRIALAGLALTSLGFTCPHVAVIGQDKTRAFLVNPVDYERALHGAIAVAIPNHPQRVKQCASCRFFFDCGPKLHQLDDISLVLPGQKAAPYREAGITTVDQLSRINDSNGRKARAWQQGITAYLRTDAQLPPLRDIEIDVDVESYLDRGAYLWGAFDGREYRSFHTFQGLGQPHEASAFAQFWDYISTTITTATAAGNTVGVYCFAAGGENHWLRSQAARFGGITTAEGLTCPDTATIEEFIASPYWIDVFSQVKRCLDSPEGLGLKIVAPLAGFHWDSDDIDGERSLHYYRIARGFITDPQLTADDAQQLLISYNRGDVRATSAVRHWLHAGAPGIPHEQQI